MEIQIGSRLIGPNHPSYFIADIAANHDGDLERARMLIRLAKQAGADAAKFQNFSAPKIVSDYGFRHMDGQVSHQATWKKSVFQVYKEASIPFEWTAILKEECQRVGIDFFSAPYAFEAIEPFGLPQREYSRTRPKKETAHATRVYTLHKSDTAPDGYPSLMAQ